MRHNKKFNHLGRKTGHRRALLKNMSNSLIEHKRIFTTLAKAKALRRHIEPLITKAVRASKMESAIEATHQRRVVFSYLQNKQTVHELFTTVAAQVGDRPGGYTRILRTGIRKGDGAETAMIEFVDFNDLYNPNNANSTSSKKKTRRSRRRSSSNNNETVKGVDQEVEGLEETTEE